MPQIYAFDLVDHWREDSRLMDEQIEALTRWAKPRGFARDPKQLLDLNQ
jgi:hypothetical protein